MLLAGYPVPTTPPESMIRRKPSWSGEFHQNGSTSGLDGPNLSKLVYKRGVLISSSSSTNISNGRNLTKTPGTAKVTRSKSLFNVLVKTSPQEQNNNSKNKCKTKNEPKTTSLATHANERRNTCVEYLFPESGKTCQAEEVKGSPSPIAPTRSPTSCSSENLTPDKSSGDSEEAGIPILIQSSLSLPLPEHNNQEKVFEKEKNLNLNNFEEDLDLDFDSDLDPDSMAALLNKAGQNPNTKQQQLQQQRRDGGKEFIPSFVLVDACKEINERKIRELVKRLGCVSSVEIDLIVNFQDPTGRTALSYACGSGNIIIIEELSKLRRLDPNMPDNEGNTPLHYASQAGHSEAVDLMLSRFEGIVDPNCRNSTGLTPLMKAALQGRTRCAKSLITAGASPYIQDYSRGLTAIEWARLCGRHICAEVIVRSVKDTYKHPGSPPPSLYNTKSRPVPASQSSMELKRTNTDDSPYYNLYQARSTVSGATWLKNKIKKALGATGTNPSSMPKSSSNGTRPESYALMSNLSGATICASSLLLPSIKPLLDQQQHKSRSSKKKLTIPTLQVTPVNKR